MTANYVTPATMATTRLAMFVLTTRETYDKAYARESDIQLMELMSAIPDNFSMPDGGLLQVATPENVQIEVVGDHGRSTI